MPQKRILVWVRKSKSSWANTAKNLLASQCFVKKYRNWKRSEVILYSLVVERHIT